MTAHLALPLRVTAGGSLAAHPAGSPAEIGASVGLLLATRIGERRSEPVYGARDPLFDPTSQVLVDRAAVARWEPRATPELIDLTLEAT